MAQDIYLLLKVCQFYHSHYQNTYMPLALFYTHIESGRSRDMAGLSLNACNLRGYYVIPRHNLDTEQVSSCSSVKLLTRRGLQACHGLHRRMLIIWLFVVAVLGWQENANSMLSSSGPGACPRSGPGQVPGLLQVMSCRSKDKGQIPGPGLYIKFGLPTTTQTTLLGP